MAKKARKAAVVRASRVEKLWKEALEKGLELNQSLDLRYLDKLVDGPVADEFVRLPYDAPPASVVWQNENSA